MFDNFFTTIDSLKTFSDWLPYLFIPFVSAFVGWFTNVIAIKMTFYPINYRGLRPFGWQGIIPSKAPKMAAKSVDLLTQSLFVPKDIFSRIDARQFTNYMDSGIKSASLQIVNEIMMAQYPVIWSNLSLTQKEIVYTKVFAELPDRMINTINDVRENINELLDLKKLTIHALVEDKSLINRIFLNVGKREFRFIEVSGLYFGFVFGLIQLMATLWYNSWWMMPLSGVIVGFLTNYLAIRLIFQPVNPIKIGPFNIQGLFLKRQTEVAAEYAKIIKSKVLTTENLFDAIFRDPADNTIHAILKKNINIAIDSLLSEIKFFSWTLLKKDTNIAIKNIALFRFSEEIPIIIRPALAYADQVLDLENTLRTKMAALPSTEFVGFLRPVFQEDEMKLIIVGAILGGLAGILQFFMSF